MASTSMYFNDKKVINRHHSIVYIHTTAWKHNALQNSSLVDKGNSVFRITLLWKNNYLFYNLNIKKIKNYSLLF